MTTIRDEITLTRRKIADAKRHHELWITAQEAWIRELQNRCQHPPAARASGFGRAGSCIVTTCGECEKELKDVKEEYGGVTKDGNDNMETQA